MNPEEIGKHLRYAHFWVGMFAGTRDEFAKCFDLTSYYNAEEGQPYEQCAFSAYLNEEAHSEDIMQWNFSNDGWDALLSDEFVGPKLAERIRKECSGRGIATANAAIMYGAIHLPSTDGIADSFAGLCYIGRFKFR